MGNLWLMIGCPASGKTTYAKKLMNEKIENAVYISRDEIRFSMLKPNESYFAKETAVYNEFCKQVNDALANNAHVIADATFLTPGSRKKFLKKITNKPNALYAIVMNTDVETCIKRNSGRVGLARVPDDAIYRMYASMVKPVAYEGFDKVWEIATNE